MQPTLLSNLFDLESNENLQTIQEDKHVSLKTSDKLRSDCSVRVRESQFIAEVHKSLTSSNNEHFDCQRLVKTLIG